MEKGLFRMNIKKFGIEDLDDVFRLLNELYNNKIQYDKFKEIYNKKLNDVNSYYIAAVVEEKIVGVLTSELQVQLHRARKRCYIEDLIVNEKYRNKGIGKALLENAISYAKDNDCEVVDLASYITNDNAHRFYEKNGFIKHSYMFKMYLNQ